MLYLTGIDRQYHQQAPIKQPDTSRIEQFIGLLELEEHQDFCNKKQLIDLQNRIVDPRFKETDYRTSQNYIGQMIDLFIRFCLQNNGSLSIKKRSAYFDFLTDDEVLQMEQSVRLVRIGSNF